MLSRSIKGGATAVSRRTLATHAPVNVTAINPSSPTASVTVLVKAGPRFESKPGVAHFLKHSAFKDTAERSALRTVRETELYGGVLTSSLSREHLALTAQFVPGNEAYFVDLLSSVLTSTRFAPHELAEDVFPAVKTESSVAHSDPAVLALDLAHTIAFRSGLGSSLFASPSHSAVTAEDIKAFADKAFTKSNVAFIGTGIEASTLEKLVSTHFGADAVAGESAATKESKYYGGESRVSPSPEANHGHSGPQTVFIGYGAAKASAAELSVLASYLDPTPAVKWSNGTSEIADLLSKATVTPVNLHYSDASLVGVLVQAGTAADASAAAQGVAKKLKEVISGNVKEEEFKKALAKAKFNAASALDTKETQIGAAGAELLFGSKKLAAESFDSISSSSFSSAVKSLASTKPTYVAVGDTTNLPFVDELGL